MAADRSRLWHVTMDLLRSKSPDISLQQFHGWVEPLFDRTKDENNVLFKKGVLDCINDLVRRGILNFGNTSGEWCADIVHFTEHGQEVIKQLSRDPANQAGYLAYLDSEASIDDVTRGYVEEALNTYAASCDKATAFLIGAAVENLVLNLRDEIVTRLDTKKVVVPKDLKHFQIKTVLDCLAKRVISDLQSQFAATKDENIRKLKEDAESKLLPMLSEFRRLRNDAGHPATLKPITHADVHANLVLFPSTAKLMLRLRQWASTHY